MSAAIAESSDRTAREAATDSLRESAEYAVGPNASRQPSTVYWALSNASRSRTIASRSVISSVTGSTLCNSGAPLRGNRHGTARAGALGRLRGPCAPLGGAGLADGTSDVRDCAVGLVGGAALAGYLRLDRDRPALGVPHRDDDDQEGDGRDPGARAGVRAAADRPGHDGRCGQQRDEVHHLDQRVDRGARGVLKRVADRV